MKRKIIFSFILLLFILSTIVFATDAEAEIIDSDLYLSEEKENILDKEISGNVFNVSNNFELSPSSIVNGDLFLVTKNVALKSDVTYTESLSKDNEPSIDRINASATINGNVYVVCTEFTLEPGVEIYGDLYIVAKSINIQKSSVVHGNIFATTGDFVLNGRVENSVYAATKNFRTNYYGSIYKDLNLTAEMVYLNSVIRRNANINADIISTNQDFLIYGDLNINADNLDFSGEVDGNAIIHSKIIDFIDKQENISIKCLIKGDLNYSSEKEIENVDSFVNGSVVRSEYKEVQNSKTNFNFKSLLLELFTFILYVFVVAWTFTLISKSHLNSNLSINVKNIFSSLGIGLLAIVIAIVLTILLLIINIGVTLSFTLIFAFIFLLFISTPLFVLDIAIIFKEKINLYLGILAISLVIFIIYQIPFIGGLISFLFITVGSGRILLKLIGNSKK